MIIPPKDIAGEQTRLLSPCSSQGCSFTHTKPFQALAIFQGNAVINEDALYWGGTPHNLPSHRSIRSLWSLPCLAGNWVEQPAEDSTRLAGHMKPLPACSHSNSRPRQGRRFSAGGIMETVWIPVSGGLPLVGGLLLHSYMKPRILPAVPHVQRCFLPAVLNVKPRILPAVPQVGAQPCRQTGFGGWECSPKPGAVPFASGPLSSVGLRHRAVRVERASVLPCHRPRNVARRFHPDCAKPQRESGFDCEVGPFARGSPRSGPRGVSDQHATHRSVPHTFLGRCQGFAMIQSREPSQDVLGPYTYRVSGKR